MAQRSHRASLPALISNMGDAYNRGRFGSAMPIVGGRVESNYEGANNGMGATSLVAGQELGLVHFDLDDSLVRNYLTVAGDRSEVYAGTDLVPLTAVAALGMRTILNGLALPPGTIHIAQELVAHRAAVCGQRVACRAQVAQASQRRDGTFLILEFTVTDDGGQALLDGRTTLIVPKQQG